MKKTLFLVLFLITLKSHSQVCQGSSSANLIRACNLVTNFTVDFSTVTSASLSNSFVNSVYPSQSGNANKILTTDGTNVQWVTPNPGTVTSVGLSSTEISIIGSPVIGSGTMSLSLASTGVIPGKYNWVTVDAKGRVTVGSNSPVPTAIASGGRNFNQAYQVSSTSYSKISLSPQISCTLSLSGGSSGQVILEISQDGSTGWIFCKMLTASNTGTLTVGLNTTQITGGALDQDLPPGYYWRLRTNNVAGTPTYTFNGGSETIN
jgi:hypothetical protein